MHRDLVYPAAAVRAAEAALRATLPADPPAAAGEPGVLMARAVVALADICRGELRRLRGRVAGARVLVVAGGGDNGGDALFAGARLARAGCAVEAVLLGADRAHAGGLVALRRAGGRVVAVDVAHATAAAGEYDLALDGIVGIGGQPGLRPVAARLVDALARGRCPIVAVDLPSGVDVDGGRVPAPVDGVPAAVRAAVTVTFGALKPCTVVGPAAEYAGRVVLVDIGLGPWLDPARAVLEVVPPEVGVLRDPPRWDAHKYRRGVVAVVAGDPMWAGALALCTGAALRTGVGMVRVLDRPGAATVEAAGLRGRWPEAVVGDGRSDVRIIGPGAPAGRWLDDEVAAAVAGDVPLVLDAAAVVAYAALRAAGRAPERPCGSVVVTPHAAELARALLAADPAGGTWTATMIEADPLGSATVAAERLGCVVLLKGPTTVVAAPDASGRRPTVNVTGTAALATAGSGDVLAGILGALIARGVDGFDAAGLAAAVHGLAGRAAAARLGAMPLAGDLVAAISDVIGGRGPDQGADRPRVWRQVRGEAV